MTIRPFSSTIDALISPGLPSIKTFQSTSPERIWLRTSVTQRGQSESVDRGKPSIGKLFSRCLASGAGAHFGWNVRSGNSPSSPRATRQSTSAVFCNPA